MTPVPQRRVAGHHATYPRQALALPEMHLI